MATNEKFILEFATKGTEALTKASATVDSLGSKIEGLNGKINSLAGIVLGAGFGTFIHGAMQSADAISDFSDATNISISSIKAFQSALDASGGKAKNTEKIINSFFAAIEKGNDGSIKTRDAFKAVGVSLDELGKLSETDLLNKTLAGLALMPAGAERAAVATELLSKAFRGVDPAAFAAALDPAKYLESEAATKKAADAIQALEAKYRTLQEGALMALEPILKMMGEHSLTTKNATTIVELFGAALLASFGLSTLNSLVKLGQAMAAFNVVSKAGLLIQAGFLALQGPKGWIQLAGALAVAGVAAYGVNAGLDKIASNKAAEDHLANLKEIDAENEKIKAKAAAPAAVAGKLLAVTDTAGDAKRKQEMDARQRAEAESAKRTASFIEDTKAEIAARGASDLQKITSDAAAATAKAQLDIYAKENLSKAAKDKEFAAASAQIAAKATTDQVAKQAEQLGTIQQLKDGYAAANMALLGQEQTELDKINATISQQPTKYKEIGDQMRANAAIQDSEKKRIEGIVAARKLDFDIMQSTVGTGMEIAAITSADIQTRAALLKLTLAGKKELELSAIATKEQNSFLSSQPGYWLDIQRARNGANSLTKEELKLADEYAAKQPKLMENFNKLTMAKAAIAMQDIEDQKNFSLGWDKAYAEYVRSTQDASAQAGQLFSTLSKGFEDAIVKFVQTGKLSFSDLVNSVIADFARIQARNLFSNLLGMAGMGGLPGRASGGPVSANTPYLVGENGPEMFIPRAGGTIIPNGQTMGAMGGGSANVTYNISAVDASSFRQLVARDPEFIYAVTEKGRNSVPGGRR